MSELVWEQIRGEFVFDGALLDIYIFGTDATDWERLIRALHTSGFRLSYSLDGEPADVPTEARRAFADVEIAAACLSVRFDGLLANTFFFTPLEIEFDIDPREIVGQTQLDALVRFMHRLADAVGKEVVLTPESCRGTVIVRARPGAPAIYTQSAK